VSIADKLLAIGQRKYQKIDRTLTITLTAYDSDISTAVGLDFNHRTKIGQFPAIVPLQVQYSRVRLVLHFMEHMTVGDLRSKFFLVSVHFLERYEQIGPNKDTMHWRLCTIVTLSALVPLSAFDISNLFP